MQGQAMETVDLVEQAQQADTNRSDPEPAERGDAADLTEQGATAEAAQVGGEQDGHGVDVLNDIRREMAELRSLVEGMRATDAAPVLTDEFRALYPDVGEGDVPDEVWESVRRGIPPEAAYALWERRELVRRQAAEAVNRKNAGGAWGRADSASGDHLSPEEVRAMSPKEVRENYARIMESMKHWG